MMCKIAAYAVPEGPPYYAHGGSKAVFQCQTHNWHSDGILVGDMCPIGRIEKAVEDGLAKLAEATK